MKHYAELAAMRGWQLVDVYDTSSSKLITEIHYIHPRVRVSAEDEVIDAARMRDPLATTLLQEQFARNTGAQQ